MLFAKVASVLLGSLLFSSSMPIKKRAVNVVTVVKYVTVVVKAGGNNNAVTSSSTESSTVATSTPVYNEVPYNYQYATTEQVVPTPEPQATQEEVPVPEATQELPSVTQTSAQAPSPTSSSGFDSADNVLMLSLINDLRSSVGKSPLAYSEPLMAAAQLQSQYQYDTNQMTHSNSNYDGLISRFAATDATCSSCAENVAAGYTSVSDVFNGWKNSPGHYANMIGNYNFFGWARVGDYWTQDFNS
ncbi:hypothetical protein AYI68_g1780 [Smittium mucronatum]|uniref:SCP domain-containing protein n=1 Tax=Smittium mucronatum TaxID=133383 RepID=A0A1R0H4T2_9FUNG|nr:hypothetical protein AYI68_g1780 [Smittium mucronatum]